MCRTDTSGARFRASEAKRPVLEPFRFSCVAGGKPFSANPEREVLRLPLTPRAGPTSPERLPVYPMWDGEIVGTGLRGGDEGG